MQKALNHCLIHCSTGRPSKEPQSRELTSRTLGRSAVRDGLIAWQNQGTLMLNDQKTTLTDTLCPIKIVLILQTILRRRKGSKIDQILTILTSDTMSMLAISMFMPTATGGPETQQCSLYSKISAISLMQAWLFQPMKGGGGGGRGLQGQAVHVHSLSLHGSPSALEALYIINTCLIIR